MSGDKALDLWAVRDSLPAHYFDCDRFEVYNYGTRQGKCDCTAPDDIARLVSEIERLRAELAVRDEALAEIAALHFDIGGGFCDVCADDRGPKEWPCPTQRILSSLQRSLDPEASHDQR